MYSQQLIRKFFFASAVFVVTTVTGVPGPGDGSFGGISPAAAQLDNSDSPLFRRDLYERQLRTRQQMQQQRVQSPESSQITMIPLQNMDVNNDGNVTMEEVRNFHRADFDSFDMNADGTLTTREIGKFVREMQNTRPRNVENSNNLYEDIENNLVTGMGFLDANGDGVISAQEFTEPRIQETAEYDLNNDNVISAAEMRALAERVQQGEENEQEDVARIVNDAISRIMQSTAEQAPLGVGDNMPWAQGRQWQPIQNRQPQIQQGPGQGTTAPQGLRPQAPQPPQRPRQPQGNAPQPPGNQTPGGTYTPRPIFIP